MKESLRTLTRDPRFSVLIKKHGTPNLKPGTNTFRALCRAIIYQQISGRAAASIMKKFVALYPHKRFPTARDVSNTSIVTLRSAGISPQKASYLHDLALKFSTNEVPYRRFRHMTNEEIVTALTTIKGIGVWTVHMFLIFTLNRPDVLPTGDLGIRKGFQIVYRLRALPTHDQMERLARAWRPHASIASWYLWRAADEAKSKNVAT